MDVGEIVEQVMREAPRVRVLLISGYSDHSLLRGGALQGDVRFLQKPFAPDTLARKVRAILDEVRSSSQGAA